MEARTAADSGSSKRFIITFMFKTDSVKVSGCGEGGVFSPIISSIDTRFKGLFGDSCFMPLSAINLQIEGIVPPFGITTMLRPILRLSLSPGFLQPFLFSCCVSSRREGMLQSHHIFHKKTEPAKVMLRQRQRDLCPIHAHDWW